APATARQQVGRERSRGAISLARQGAAGRSHQRRDGRALLVDRLEQSGRGARLRGARSAADARRYRELFATGRRSGVMTEASRIARYHAGATVTVLVGS